MFINEAISEAMKRKLNITRKKFNGTVVLVVENRTHPTMLRIKGANAKHGYWCPTTHDLIANDWILTI